METRNDWRPPADRSAQQNSAPATSPGQVLVDPELELLLEELAAAIEAENGILTP